MFLTQNNVPLVLFSPLFGQFSVFSVLQSETKQWKEFFSLIQLKIWACKYQNGNENGIRIDKRDSNLRSADYEANLLTTWLLLHTYFQEIFSVYRFFFMLTPGVVSFIALLGRGMGNQRGLIWSGADIEWGCNFSPAFFIVHEPQQGTYLTFHSLLGGVFPEKSNCLKDAEQATSQVQCNNQYNQVESAVCVPMSSITKGYNQRERVIIRKGFNCSLALQIGEEYN